jgi:peptidoglycan/LPS O-acetylase OafA/YrhL
VEIKSHTGLRGIAATIVFIVHFFGSDISKTHWFLSFYSVDLFFVLSGFILYWVYIANKNCIDWKNYAIARAARILPLYYLTLIICIPIVYNQLPIGSGLQLAGDIFANVFLLSTILGKFTFNGPSWSISVEWFCYFLLFPLLILFRKYILNNRFGLMVSVICVLILSRLFILTYRSGLFKVFGIDWETSLWGLERGFLGFSMGFFLCFIFSKINLAKAPNFIFDILLISLFVIVIISGLKWLPPHFILYSIPFIVLTTAYEKGFTVRIFELKFIQWLGTRSYSIYLWHWLVIEYTKFLKGIVGLWGYAAVVAIIVFILSEISYKYFEMPLRKLIKNAVDSRNAVRYLRG